MRKASRVLMLLVSCLSFVVGCGGSTPATTASSATCPSTRDTLIFGVAFWTSVGAPIGIAIANHYFDKACVNVTVELQGASAGTQLASGHNTVTEFGPTATFQPTLNGHLTKNIFAVETGGPAGDTVAVATNSNYKTIMDLSGKSIVVPGTAGLAYGAAVTYVNYIKSNGGVAPKLVPVDTPAAQIALVSSGQAAAAVSGASAFANAVQAGQMRILVSADSDLAKQLFPNSLVAVTISGTDVGLRQHKDGVTRFIAGLQRSYAWMKGKTPAQVAHQLKTYSGYDQLAEEQLTQALAIDLPNFSGGFITPSDWQSSLNFYSTWGLQGVDTKASDLGYNNIVDMSYWQAAQKIAAGITD
jgi:ABC-type nitrate/sulfonate/bicarbonate transport system substrate-binding protein